MPLTNQSPISQTGGGRKRQELQASVANSPSIHIQLEMKKVRSAFRGQSVTLDDLLEAEMSVIRFAQQRQFKEEIDTLSNQESPI